MEINKQVVEYCKKNLINLNQFTYLYTKFIGEDWGLEITESDINFLKLLKFIENNEVSPVFIEFLSSLKGNEVYAPLNEEELSNFNEFWQEYPSTDEWGNYEKTRIIKNKKHIVMMEYGKILRAGEKHSVIMNGLRNCIEKLKSSSTSTENKLRFIKSPLNFLRDKVYLDYFKKHKEDFSYLDPLQ